MFHHHQIIGLHLFGKNFIKDMGFDVDKPKGGAKSKERVKQIE